jgi:hypothetical protein
MSNQQIIPFIKIAIVFFTYRPPIEIFEFAEKLKNNKYDVYVSVNDNEYEIPEYDKNKITIIKLDNHLCYNEGYFNTNINIKNLVNSRDKALYYFNRINSINYKYIWFIEDDTFIPTTHTLSDLDNKYLDGDYLTNDYFTVYNLVSDLHIYQELRKDFSFIKFKNNFNFNHGFAFEEIHLYYPFPWIKSMSNAIRVSMNFMQKIDEIAKKFKKLAMDEVLFPTLSLHNNLKIIVPIEFSPIVWRREVLNDFLKSYNWDYNQIRSEYLYHPIKDLKLQKKIRIEKNFD